jgi:Sulfotransferase family
VHRSPEPTSARAPGVAAKVVYVMGAGHSGSTILGLALGNCSDSFYAGELDEWLLVSGKPSLGGAERTKFWDDVREAMRDGGAQELFGGEVNRLVERSSSLLRFDRWPERRAMLRRYGQVSEELLRAIARTASASYVVDTSHFPLRARELQKLDGVELYLVLLVRDPQDVVASNVREISRHEVAERRIRILTMNANLWLTQLLSLLVFLRQPRERRVFVRHESFIADPEGVLRQVVDSLGTGVALPDLTALRAGVALQGNSLIMSQTIAVKRSTLPTVRWSRSTDLLQSCWRPLLARLRPEATASADSLPSHGPS